MTDTQPAFQVVSKGGLKIRTRLLLRKIQLYTRYALRSISSFCFLDNGRANVCCISEESDGMETKSYQIIYDSK